MLVAEPAASTIGAASTFRSATEIRFGWLSGRVGGFWVLTVETMGSLLLTRSCGATSAGRVWLESEPFGASR